MKPKYRTMLALIHSNKHFVIDVESLKEKFIVHPLNEKNKKELLKQGSIAIIKTTGGNIRVVKLLQEFMVNIANRLSIINEANDGAHIENINKFGCYALPSQFIAICFPLKNNTTSHSSTG